MNNKIVSGLLKVSREHVVCIGETSVEVLKLGGRVDHENGIFTVRVRTEFDHVTNADIYNT